MAKFGTYPLTAAQRRRRVRQIAHEMYELLRDGRAALARVVRAESGWEGGYEAGPVYEVDYEFEDETGETRSGTCGGAFDGMHLAYGGGNEWTDFLAAACDGKVRIFTVLHDGTRSVPVACLFSW